MNPTVITALEQQATHELFAAQSYLAMACWCEVQQHSGFARFFHQQAGYDFERANTAGIHAAYEAALMAKDYPAQIMLHWFINEQVEEEAWSDKLLVKVREAGCAGALMNLDRHLEKILGGDAGEE